MSTETGRARPSGRRPGDSGTRDAILTAALTLFAERGYDGSSIRAIATAAGVDPALVRHFFGDKDGLFAAAIGSVTPGLLVVALGDDPAAAGRSLADAYLGMWENPATRPVLLALVRSATTSPAAAHMLREVIGAKLGHVAGLDGVAADRVALAASQLLGVAVARHVIGLEPVVALSHDELVDRVAPGVQRCLTGDG